MTRLHLSVCLLVLAGTSSTVAQGQAPVSVQAAPGDADRLAGQMRLLAVNANDLSALLTAGELSVKLDDLGAAASFFARADKVDPRNGRAKAGEASILVHAERPGEALRYFALAESFGLAPAAFAADRGLAYDLIGEQERAQRDYRLALRTAPSEEAQRRYALSLAISGKRDLADQQLQGLLRQSDRGAWRVHAFVLAMAGNVAEASRIATAMMPPGTAAGLLPFLEKLPTLSPIDRAYAVHFGEVRSTPERLADARLVPALPALGVDPYAPRISVAAVVPAAAADKGKRRKDKRDAVQVQVAVAVPAPVPLPQAPSYRTAGAPVAVAARAAVPIARMAPPPETNVVVGAPASVPRIVIVTPAPVRVVVATPAPPIQVAVQPTPITRVVVASQPPIPVPSIARAAVIEPSQIIAPVTVATTTQAPRTTAPETQRPVLASLARTVTTSPAVAPPIERAAIARPPRGTSALGEIVAALPIPASELGVGGPARAASVRAAPPEAPDAAAQLAADKERDRVAAAKALADKRTTDRKAAADKKALAEKKAAAEQKAEDAREAAAQKKIERANPERIWVQVAGGARESDLPKAWAAAKAKGGDVFAGHASGWTTPLRFTNRVLAGPFKTNEEARAFVNKLRGKGMSTFTFTSDAGQPVRKLDSE